MTDQQFETVRLKLDAILGALDAIEVAIRETKAPPPSSKKRGGK